VPPLGDGGDSLSEARAAVVAAFPARAPGPGVAIAASGKWFDEAGREHGFTSPESAEVEGFFDRRPWTSIDAEELSHWKLAAHFKLLSPQGLACYLPAHMMALLARDLDDTAFTVLESLLWALTPGTHGADASHSPLPDRRSDAQRVAMTAALSGEFVEFLQLLTADQKRSVALFLRAVEQTCPPLAEDAHLASHELWDQFLDL
jgi:hypothetical protein